MAIRLNLKGGPVWVEVVSGVRLLVEPLTTSIMVEAREDLLADLGPDAVPQDVDDARANERFGIALAKAVARVVVIDWEGVEDEAGRPAEVSGEAIDALLDVWPVFEGFQRLVLEPGMRLEREKNGSALSLSGTSAGAGNTAQRVRRAATSAQGGKTARKPARGRRSGT